MTTSELITLVNDQRRDTTSYFVADDEITRYFNQCLRMLQQERDWDFTQTSAAFTYASGSNEYALSALGSGYWKNPIALHSGYQNAFEFVTPEDFLVLSALNYNVYAVRGDFLLVNNETNTTQLSAIYYTSCMAKTSGGTWQAELSASDDVPLLPGRFQDILVDYTLAQVFRKEGGGGDFQLSQQAFERKLKNLKNEYLTKTARPLKRWKHVTETATANIRYDRREDPLQTA